MRILVVEDEKPIADNIRFWLERGGFGVTIAGDGEEAWFLGDVEDFAAVILDLGMPRLDGLSILKRWRSNGRFMPVIVLTGQGSCMERVAGIDAGADDYLPKPFEMEELRARLHSLLRRAAGHATNVLAFGPLTVNTRQKSVMLGRAPVDLTQLEFRLLMCFVLQAGVVLSSSELLQQLYGPENDQTVNGLEALLGRLRRKIGSDLIATRRGLGYFLKADV